MKTEVRSVSFDDGSFKKGDSTVVVIGAVMRGNSVLEGILSTSIDVDGDNATTQLVSLLNNSKHKDQLRCIFLDGIAFGGFNVVDIATLNKRTGLPVIVVSRKRPNMDTIKNALKHVKNGRKKWNIINSAGPIYTFKNIYFQCAGCSENKAKEFIAITLNRSNLPEGIRIAHLVATGVSRGESTAHP